jgi:two-component system LytT family response regulator
MPKAEWTVLIADDEPAARLGVRQLLAKFPAFRVVSECRNGREVLAALDVVAPDLVFLDVQMPEVDGFEVLRRRTPERMPAVVFLTAYDQFAIRAFEVEAHDYLVKPVSEARFAATMERLTRRLQGGAARARERGLVVSTARGALVLPLDEIDWIESADNYVRVWAGGRSYLLRESLADLRGRLRPHGFEQAHRGALVRLSGVRELVTRAQGDVVAALECGVSVPISRRRRREFVVAVRAATA